MVLNKTFTTREITWCDMNGNARSLHFELPVSYKALLPNDRQTVKHVYHHLHVLPFDARFQEHAVDLDLLDPVVDMLYEKHSTHHQNLVAYRGGRGKGFVNQVKDSPCGFGILRMPQIQRTLV